MINIWEVNETNKMVEQENLDVRTITIGISLLECIDSDLKKLNENIYNRITTVAKDLAAVGEKIENEYGIPIVNKRISVTPIALVGGAACKTPEDFATIADTLDRAAKTVGANLIGGYSALVSKGMTKADEMLIHSIPMALCRTERVCSSVNLASTKTGINMDAVKLMGEILLELAEQSKDRDSADCMKLVVFCNAPDDNPFMAGAFHGVTEADAIINVGVSGPGVVKTALEKVRGENFEVLCETIKKTAFKITRLGQLVANLASERLGVPAGIIDLSLAPTPAIGDSVANILEEMGLESCGCCGTTACLALLNDAVKKGGVMASNHVGGLSGAFIPVSEDDGMINAANCGSLTLDVCPTPYDQTLPAAKDMLSWDQTSRVIGFRNDYRNYAGDVFRHGASTPLERAEKQLTDARYTLNGHTWNLQDYLKRENVSGMLVLKDGKVAWKYLAEGNTDTTLWTSRSVGKSVVSTLVGIAIQQGKIHSLDDLITVYEPELKGTAWDGVTLKQLIQHTSGVEWNEDYTDPQSHFARLTQCEAHPGAYACVRKIVTGLARQHPAGEQWSYSSGGAWLLGDILERGTGMSLAAWLEQALWQPAGMAHDGVWHAYQQGKHDVGAHGFNATLEDWGRFGEFVARDGRLSNGKQLVPTGWFDQAASWTKALNSVSAAHPEGIYGYQWWNNAIPANAQNVQPTPQEGLKGSLWALGIYGQVIMVNRAEHLVIVQWSTWPQAEPSFNAQPLEAALMYSAIARELR